jgi:hypothetical protein
MNVNATIKQDERRALPSASPWARYELCNGSWQLEQEAIRLGQAAHAPTKDTELGNRVHAFLAGIPDEDGKEIKLDDKEQARADALQDLSTEQVERIFGDSPYGRLNEKRLWLRVKDNLVLSGQFDRCVYTKHVLLIQDFKSGWIEPEPAETNAQLKVLSVLGAIAVPEVTEVIAQIVSEQFGVTEARYDIAKLSRAYNEILETLDRIHDERAELVPGVVQCKRCPAINICQAVKNRIKPVAITQISELPDDADRAGRLLDEVALLKEHLEEIEHYYKGRMSLDPTYKIAGYAMVPGNTRREVSDWDQAWSRLEPYIAEGEIKPSYTLGEVEAQLGRALKLKPKAAKEKLNQILDGLIAEKQNAASLKRVGKPSSATLAAGTTR